MACEGNPEESCGGFLTLELFSLDETTPTDPDDSVYVGCYQDTLYGRTMVPGLVSDAMTVEVRIRVRPETKRFCCRVTIQYSIIFPAVTLRCDNTTISGRVRNNGMCLSWRFSTVLLRELDSSRFHCQE